MGTRARNSLYVLTVLGAAAHLADARSVMHDFGPRRVPFELQDRPVASPAATAVAQPTFLTSGPIAALRAAVENRLLDPAVRLRTRHLA